MVRLLLLALLAPAAWAQVSASISGTVFDQSGAVIPGAKVTVESAENGAVRTATTGESGTYRIAALPLGEQKIKVEFPPFATETRTGVRLVVGEEAVVNITMSVVSEARIDVNEDAPVVNATTASTSGVVNSAAVKELPLNGRSFDNLITLNPGAISYNLKSANTSTSNGNTFTVAGRRPSENIVLFNGIEYSGTSQLGITPGGVSGQLLGIDAVREFNVLTDTYSAEYGKRAGAQVTVVTQSGSNAVHGSLFEFIRNSALDARNFFDQGAVPPFRRNQFGGALGGPVRRNKLFLFGNYEGFRQTLALSNVSVVPDASARTGVLPASFTGLNPAMLKYFALWPAANGPSLGSGTALSYNHPRQSAGEGFGTLRADYNLRETDAFTAAYTIDNGNSVIPQGDPLFASALSLRAQVASAQETHILSPNMLNTVRLGFTRAAFRYDSDPLAAFDHSLDFVTGGGPGGIVIGGGVTTSAGSSVITSAGPNNASNVRNRRNLYTLTDTVDWIHGIHQISLGGWFQRVEDNEDTASRRLGQATFTSLTTFLQGTAATFQVVPAPSELGWRSAFGAWFVQDAIRLRRNLTLSLGLRHEFTDGWNEVSGRAANYVTDANGVLTTAPRIGKSEFTKNNATRLFSPRAALAWDVFSDGTTSLRAGFGIYYSLIDDLAFLINSVPPTNGAASYSNVSLPAIVPVTPGIPTPAGTIFAPQGVQPDAKTPAVEEWNLHIERRLSANMVLRLGYVGSFGYHGFVSIDPNTIAPQICQSATCVSGGTPGTAKGSVPMGAEYIPIAARPNPNLGAGFFWYTEGNSSYHALQADFERRLAKRLQLRANFTWSKNLDVNSALTGAQANNQAQMVEDRFDLHRDWGRSALNVKLQSGISARYELPYGFQLNGIVTLLSGFPFTPQDGSNRSGDGNTRNPDRPSLNPAFNGPVITGNPNQWFNPSAFVLPTAGTWGNLGRATFLGPSLADVDLSLFKNVRLRERLTAQFRGEVFNIANHPNFATPNTTVFSSGVVSPSAGLISSTVTTSRQIQFGLKLIF